MKLYLMSENIALRSRWISVFASFKPSTLAVFTSDIDSNSVVMISDTLLNGLDDNALRTFFRHKVMVLSMVPNFEEAQKFLQLGAMGYGNAMMHESHLHSVYQALEEGKVWLHPDFISQMIMQFHNKSKPEEKSSKILNLLSKREREVAIMLGDGATHQQIADELEITIRTVKAHAASIYQKLDVKDRLALSILLHS